MDNGLGRKLLTSLVLGVVVALIVGAVAVLLLGRPPKSFRLAAGQPGGMYEAFAASLRVDLAAQGYRVEILETAGSVENAELLRTGQADVGLVQSGTDLLTDMGASTALAEVFYEPFWLFARAGAIPLVEGVPRLDGKRVSVGLAGSGTNATARTLLEQSGASAIPFDMSTDEAVQGLRDGTIDGAFLVVAANAPIIEDLVAIPGIEIMPIPNVEGYARRLPYLSPVMLFRGVLHPGEPVMPPEDMPMLAARATLMGREGLHPDLARLIVREVPDFLPLPYVGELDAFPSLDHTTFPVNQDARKFLEEGPTPLEAFLPFEIASPLSRVYLILLPLLVILFPLYTLAKAGWAWINNSRVVGWYPRISAIERNLQTSSLDELMVQQDFLRGLDAQLAGQKRVPAGYMATYYDLRTDAAFVRRKVEARIQEVGGEEALAAAQANDLDAPIDPRSISDAAMGIRHEPPTRGPG
jgi:TRAP transporter TAXI family solute receptor